MAIEKITMPQLGESVTEGTITKWMIAVGDRVNQYDPLAEVMTDKVTAEIPSLFTGIITDLGSEDHTYAVGEVICSIETEAAGDAAAVHPVSVKAEGEPAPQMEDGEQTAGKSRYSPAVLKLSQEHDIDLKAVKGTGAGGRITRKDVQRIIESGVIPQVTESAQEATVVQSEVQEPALAPAALPPMPVITGMGDIEIPVTGVRKAIASNMVRSKSEIPHAWMMIEADVTNLVKYRQEIKDEFKQKEGFNLTFFAFFVKAVAQALKEFPQLNSTWAGDKIIQRKEINISIAVASNEELFVPVIKNADEKSIKAIAREITELAAKARTGRLTVNDMQGGTFTINNTGTFGSIQSVGIINYPQAAILQVESIVKRPVVIDDMLAIRDMINLCLSLDHRILDGLICGKFLSRVKELLEKVSKEHTSVY
ncbi:dihydrolipoamide acetyltransferase family protein [Bacillus benzoevorans]|uniref:Dihydrolipoamide acetyltransferase component of pyruvate dehydrogenase complex n=1 Tax=Bacillus benzoevorans TaxID=1456 RepID=A0A7X0LW15_9BACI|nr:dihydrolipoamide acetyltransferase family protein [Bacillus benzoevorans]MBB6444854.1 2-oxoisovalerate dehydrogenase E2 component (dihydrolipoyl transacylase) [Bacillus benzoevorans]